MATHVLKGYKIGNPSIKRLMDNAVIHVVPGVDPGFDNVSVECDPSVEDEVGKKLLMSKSSGMDAVTSAFTKMLAAENYDTVLLFGGGSGVKVT